MVVSRKGLVYDESLLLCVNTGRTSETNMDMNIVINGYSGNFLSEYLRSGYNKTREINSMICSREYRMI